MRLKSIFIVLAVLLFVSSCKSPNAPSGANNDSSNPGETVYQPKAGDWTAGTAFGTLEFNVNDSGTYVTKVTLTFNGWKGRSGGVSSSKDPGWAISSRSFKIETSIVGDSWTIEGTFENSGDKASGNWTAVIGGQTENGTWSAAPKS